MGNMNYYTFATQQEAIAAESAIVANIREWVANNIPDALAADGSLRGSNAATGEWSEATTTQWDVPRQISDGRWVIAAPAQQRIAPIPLAVAVAGIDANQEAANVSWWPAQQEEEQQ
jgi:hypothetical protein